MKKGADAPPLQGDEWGADARRGGAARPHPARQGISSSSLLLSSLELRDTNVYEPYIRVRLGTAAGVVPTPEVSR